MLSIQVNGRDERLNIGCRSFVYLAELLAILETKASPVTLNGEVCVGNELAHTVVKSGDILFIGQNR